jgi:hypothetical protein
MDVVDETLMTPSPFREGLLQMIEQNDQKHDEAHKRLREDFREFLVQHENLLTASQSLRDRIIANENRLESLKDRPPDLEKAILSVKVVVAMIVFAITVVGGSWGASYSGRSENAKANAERDVVLAQIRSDIRDMATRQDAEKEAKEADRRASQLRDEQWNRAIEAMQRRIEMIQYDPGKGRTK